MDIIQRNLFRLLRSGAYGTQEQYCSQHKDQVCTFHRVKVHEVRKQFPKCSHSYFLGTILSNPVYGTRFFGIRMEPSACWLFSMMAIIARVRAMAVPFSMCR